MCEDSYGKYGYWYKTRADHKKGIELHKRLSEKDFEKVKGFYGIDYVENNVDSAYRGHLPSRIRFFIMILPMIILKKILNGRKRIAFTSTNGQ